MDETAKEANVSLSAWPYLHALSDWFAVYWWGVVGWALATALIGMFVAAHRDERKYLPARVLERYLMRAMMLELTVLNRDADVEVVKKTARQIQLMRGDLLNMIPKIFNQASAPAFQGQAMTHIGKAREQTSDLPDAEDRAWALANVQSFVGAIAAKWQAYNGANAPMP